jgi:copper transport protein
MQKLFSNPRKIRGIDLSKLLFLFGLVSLLALLPAGQAEAHANYDHSDPAANFRFASGQSPDHVQVWFTESIEPSFSRLEVYNSARQRVDQNDSRTSADARSLTISLKPALPDDAYTVVYRNVSADDGHALTGGFSFVIGGAPLPSNVALLQELEQQDNNFNIWSISIRWLNYLGLAALIGGFAFLLSVWRPAVEEVREAVGDELVLADKRMHARTVRLALWGLLALLVGWGAFLLYQASIVSASPVWLVFSNGALSSLLFKSRFGLVWLARLGLLALAFLGWVFVRREALAAKEIGTEQRSLLLIVAGLAIALTTTLDAHAAANKLNWLLVPSDVLHLACMGLWFGGLMAFVLAVPFAVRALVPGTGNRTRLWAALVPRFTRVALLSVVLLAVTGTLQAVVLLGSFSALFESDYGRALIVKLCIFLVLLAFGAFHFRLIGPRLKAFAVRNDEEGGASSLAAGTLQRMFQKSLRNEAIFAVLLLLSVGAMTSLSPPPPPTNPTNQLLYQGQMNDLRYRLAISPGLAGPNTLELSLTNEQGQPITKTDSVFVRFTMEDMDMGVQVLDLTPVAGKTGLYQASGTELAMLGHWQLTLVVQRSGFDDAKTNIQLLMAQ